MKKFDWSDEHRENPEDVDKALARVRGIGTKKRVQRKLVASGATAAVAMVLIAGIVGINTNGRSGNSVDQLAQPSTSTPTSAVQLSLAAKVTQIAEAALSNAETIRATEHRRLHDVNLKEFQQADRTTTSNYRIAKDGSYYQTADTTGTNYVGTDRTAYDATTGIVTTCTGGAEIEQCVKRVGADTSLYRGGLNAFAAAISEAALQGLQTSATSEGSDSWTLEFDTHPAFSGLMPEATKLPLHVRLDVDQETGFPTRLSTTIDGQPIEDISLTDVRLNTTLSDDELTLTPPKGLPVDDETTSYATPDLVRSFTNTTAKASALGLPVNTLEGYQTREFWTTQHGSSPYVDSCNAGSDSNTTMIDQTSRKGLLGYTVKAIQLETCANLPTPDAVLGEGSDGNQRFSVEATEGLMKGYTFGVWLTSNGSMVAIGRNDTYWAVISGDLNEDEMVGAINGFSVR